MTSDLGQVLTIVIPVLNEEEIVEKSLLTLGAYFDRVVGTGRWKFNIVDNGSTDKTPAILTRVLENYPGSRVVVWTEPNYGAALRAGLSVADTDFVHICDIEQWDLPFVAWAWTHRDEHDVFVGSKRSDPTIAKQHNRRRILSWGLNSLLQLFFGYMGTETHGPKLINMVKVRSIIAKCTSDRGQFDTEIVLRSVREGLRVAEAPIAFFEQRPPRVRLIRKVLFNLVAFNKLRRIMKTVPYSGGVIEFRQFARSDILKAGQAFDEVAGGQG